MWENLFFEITKQDGSILTLGKDKYAIKKDNKLFDNLLTFEEELKEREIEIEVYYTDVQDIKVFQDFFELQKRGKNYKYDLKITANNKIYKAQCYTDDKPFDVTEIDDLFFLETQPTATIALKLIIENQYLYSETGYKKSIGASSDYFFRYPYYVGMNNKTNNIIFGLKTGLQPYNIDNAGNEDNGVVVTVETDGDLLTPIIRNKTTGFEMGLNLSMDLGDILVVDTIKKSVIFNGEQLTNVKRLFDKWLTLQEGVNVVEFGALVGEDNATVTIEFFNKFRSVQA